MKTLVRVLIVLPLALVIILLAVANRTPVQVSLDPFSGAAPLVAFSAPLFVVLLVAAAVGVVWGGLAVWWSQGRYRRAARERARELDRVRAEAAHQRQSSWAPAAQSQAIRPAAGPSSAGVLAPPARANVH
ncbi:lipopolysaccharide assembly protein LapA domain-containing protein [Pseudochelatococcus sp. B33]